HYASQLFVGEYHDSNRINELAEKSTGISRIAVCRMDVDDLGKAFISGFERPHAAAAEDQYKYVTISRTASFSRQMSRFFKYYINSILARVTKDALAVTIVYSGGDDVFLVGAWDHILEAAMRIQEDFQTYTCHTLHLSAGILLKNAKYPIRRSASEAAELEAFAKSHDGKNAVTIFEASAQQTYPWQIFQDKVINEKQNLLERFFANQEDAERGKAFLYRLLDLLRNSEQRINLARFAYLLARLEPKKNNPSYAMYAEFSKQMYQWYRNPTDRQQLITAIYIYVYQTRMKGDTDRA
ncbi:type III-A CRISPR-associated protein Cas10/Csm1, partial [Butyricicoccus sp.]